MTHKTSGKKISEGKMIAATAAGAAAIGAGAYYLFGPNGKANQKKAKALAVKIKNEVTREVKKAKEISVPVYHKAVDTIAKNYKEQYKLHEKDIKAIAEKLKSEWRGVSGRAARRAKGVKGAVKKSVSRKTRTKKR